jgi:DNA primase
MGASAQDRILLLLSIKEPEKKIDSQHILEKVSRDMKVSLSENSLLEELQAMMDDGMIRSSEKFYYITEKGMETLRGRLESFGSDLNLSYRMVLKAKWYYQEIAEFILPFLRGRPVSIVKIFSDDSDPLGKVKPLFVRYARYKPSPVFIKIDSAEDLKMYVDDHALDYIPYVHSFEMKEPDWLVLDLDAGEELKKSEKGFLSVKYVASKLAEMLQENEVNYAVKFSGSRGIQIWSSLENKKIPGGDLFASYRALIQSLQTAVDERIRQSKVPSELRELAEAGMTTSVVAKKSMRAGKVLVDWSSMKLYGDVRAPFSIHYKTQLVSCPVDPAKLMNFDPSQSEPERVVKEAEKLFEYFNLKKSDPTKLLRTLG